jgi:hypothetical protein
MHGENFQLPRPIMKSSESVFLLPVPTESGAFLAGYSQTGLCELRFPGSEVPKTPTRNSQVPENVRRWHLLTCRAVEKALAGRPLGQLPPLDLSRGTEFQRHVWAAMQSIPLGQTSSYGGIAVCSWWGLRREPHTGADPLPPRAGRQPAPWRFFGRPGLENKTARL